MFAEITLSPVTKAVYNRIPRKVKIGAWLQPLAFRAILHRVYRRFARHYPQWMVSLFDEHFLSHGAAPILARYLQQTTPPEPIELAVAWDEQLGPASLAVRERRIAEFTLAAADFLDWLEAELKRHPLFHPANA